MREAVIVDAVRTPIARGKMGVGELSGLHATELLSKPMQALIERNQLEHGQVDYVAGGCVTQAGEQASNVVRNAWLSLGKDFTAGGTTLDNQCGSAQTANHMIASLIQTGSLDIAIACGVESMSRVRMGSNVMNGPGNYLPPSWPWDTPPNQFIHAERVASRRGITRQMADEFGLRSQQLAAQAWQNGHFDREVIKVQSPQMDEEGKPTGAMLDVVRDQGMRATTLEGLASLNSIMPDGVHTAGTSSQISDGAAAVLWMSKEKALELGLKPRARILADCVVGTDPYYLLDGPVDATARLLERSGMKTSDIDLFEVNEAFAGVVLSWASQFDIDMNKVNVNGGAIALGHPVGSTGARLICTALHELERQDKSTALISMCCGSAVGTGTIIERIG